MTAIERRLINEEANPIRQTIADFRNRRRGARGVLAIYRVCIIDLPKGNPRPKLFLGKSENSKNEVKGFAPDALPYFLDVLVATGSRADNVLSIGIGEAGEVRYSAELIGTAGG